MLRESPPAPPLRGRTRGPTRPRRRRRVLARAPALALLAAGAGGAWTACAPAPPDPGPADAVLEVDSAPPGADVEVDGRRQRAGAAAARPARARPAGAGPAGAPRGRPCSRRGSWPACGTRPRRGPTCRCWSARRPASACPCPDRGPGLPHRRLGPPGAGGAGGAARRPPAPAPAAGGQDPAGQVLAPAAPGPPRDGAGGPSRPGGLGRPGGRRPALVLVDPHRDLARAALGLVPPARRGDVVFLDVGQRERPFGLNLLDTGLFRDRDKAVANALAVFRREFTAFWGPRMEDAFRFALLTLYEANRAHLRRRPARGGPASTPSWRCRPSWWTPPSGGRCCAWWPTRWCGPGGAATSTASTGACRWRSSTRCRPRCSASPAAAPPARSSGSRPRRSTRRPGCATGPSCSSTPPRAPWARTPPRWSAPPCSTWWRWPSASRRRSTRGRAGPVSAPGGRVPRHARGRLRGRPLRAGQVRRQPGPGHPEPGPAGRRSTASSSGRCARPCSPTWTGCSPSTAAPRTPSTWCGSSGQGVDEADLVALGEHRCYARISSAGERLPVFSVRLAPPPASQPRNSSSTSSGEVSRKACRTLRGE